VRDVSAGMREIWLRGPDLVRLRCAPGSHVVVQVPTASGIARRVYSVWSWSPQNALIILRVAVHGREAPGCAWALAVKPGDRVNIEPPRTKISLDSTAAFHLFVGDETGAVPLLAMHAALYRRDDQSRPSPVFGVFESTAAAEEVPGAPDVPPLPWVHRGSASAVASPVLLKTVRALELPSGTGTAYLAGESRTCQLLQRFLVETRGWPRRAVKTQAQWVPGRTGFGAGSDDLLPSAM
jgi:NADPH-dependent ferric siderophore reductase